MKTQAPARAALSPDAAWRVQQRAKSLTERPVPADATPDPVAVGRYEVVARVAVGSSATVYEGQLSGAGGFKRKVAIKRLHARYAADPAFVASFAAEARIAASIHHANVGKTLDVIEQHEELFVVLEFIAGRTMHWLLASLAKEGKSQLPADIACGIALGAIQGLTAAHEASDVHHQPLHLVHGGFSERSIIVGFDGVARVFGFATAKAAKANGGKREGSFGKLKYMAPEQATGGESSQGADIFSAGVLLWEALAGRSLFGDAGEVDAIVSARLLTAPILPPSTFNPSVPAALDAVVLRALSRNASQRFPTARALADALGSSIECAPVSRVAEYLSGRVEHDAQASLQAVPDPAARAFPSRKRQGVSRAVVLAAAMGVCAAAGGVAWVQQQGPPTPLPSTTATGAAHHSTMAAIPAAVELSTLPPEPSAEPRTPQRKSAPAIRSKPPSTPKTRAVDCRVPSVVDEEGIKHFKPECL